MRDGLSLLDRLISTGVEPLGVSLLEEFLGCPNSEKIYNLIGQIGDSDAAGTLAAIEDLTSSGLGEVQIIDSLIDYMRDLMVVKSTDADSELLVLTAEQRGRSAELAEKFDIAALVYNITALEKLRWTIKNSDTPRALLEALALRFALSEHFLNVDELIRQSHADSAGVIKKKQPVSRTQNPAPDTQKMSHEIRAPGNEQRGKPETADYEQAPPKTPSQRRNEIVNDPAVKTVLMELDATITGIEENEKN